MQQATNVGILEFSHRLSQLEGLSMHLLCLRVLALIPQHRYQVPHTHQCVRMLSAQHCLTQPEYVLTLLSLRWTPLFHVKRIKKSEVLDPRPAMIALTAGQDDDVKVDAFRVVSN